MSMEFGFAAVPFRKDGHIDELFKDEPEVDVPKEGVVFWVNRGMDKLSIDYFGLNILGVQAMNEMTQGVFLKLCEGGENQRYILLELRKQHLMHLRKMLPNPTEVIGRQNKYQKWLACFLDNADACIAEYGARAAVLIY